MPLIPAMASYRQQHTCCRRRRCRTCDGVRYAHGPYWVATWWADGRTRSAYVGKTLPPGVVGTRCDCWRCYLRSQEHALQRQLLLQPQH